MVPEHPYVTLKKKRVYDVPIIFSNTENDALIHITGIELYFIKLIKTSKILNINQVLLKLVSLETSKSLL